ncbi:MAG: efflux RND transporter permease subunit [Myxococcota bacterium]
MKIADVSIRRPVFAAMLTLGLVVLGLVSVGRLELKLDPDIDFPFAVVVTELRGASPETVEREVTDILEERLNAIEGVRNLSSTSSQGLSRVFLEFGLQYEIDTKVQEVRDKVALARPLLPIDVEDPVVQKFDLSSIGFMTIVLGGPISRRDLSDFAENDVKERLERIAGVGGVNVLGAREREIRIWLDPLRLTGYGLSIEDVSNTLRRENAELASGRIEGAEREWTVTTQGKARSVEEFGEIIVAERQGRTIRLRDVAVVEDGMEEEKTVARFDGEPGVALEIQQQSGSDVVAAARAIRAELELIREQAPAGVSVIVARDYAQIIEEQVYSVVYDMLLAGLLVVGVVLCFLRNYRSTFIAGLAIPASVIASFTFLYIFDLSLNNMTLMALSLAIGLVIDDAIVVLESIFRKVEAGNDSMSAAYSGSAEVGLAVISTTLAVCGVFVPIRFMESTMGRYFLEFGITVTVAVAVSSLVALTLTPMLASRVLRQNPKEGPIFRALSRALVALESGYRRLLGGALRHRIATGLVAFLTIFGGCYVASTLPLNYFTQDDLSEAQVTAKLPIGTPLGVTDRVMRRIEEAIALHPDVRGMFATAGRENEHKPHFLRINVLLTPKDERDVPIQTTFEELREQILAGVPEATNLTVAHPEFASGSGEGFYEIMHGIQGPDLLELEAFADELTARMEEDPVFVDVRSSFETGRPEIQLDVDRGRAADLGVSATALGRTLRTLLAGEKVGSFEDLGNRYDVRVQVLPEYRDDPSKIDLIRVRSARGELVPISNAARVNIEEGPVEVRRQNRTRSIRLYANTAPDESLSVAMRKMDRWAEEIGIAPPYALVPAGQAESGAEAARDIFFGLGLAMISIYMILASLFNSLTHPFTIMMSAPLSFIGGFLALKLAGMPLDIMSGMGLLVLMGLVMKNGILLVDYTNQLREQGLDRNEAILRAGPVRMRPVLMTSAALIFGLMPLALSDATGAEFRAPMAVIVIGGLVTSTLLTLVVVPVFYTLVDGATTWTRHALGRGIAALRRRPPRARTPVR